LRSQRPQPAATNTRTDNRIGPQIVASSTVM
jgi:hypothetical protein